VKRVERSKIVFVLCIVALLFITKGNVYAAEYYGDFKYEEEEKSVAIHAYNGAEAEVTIPAYIKDKPVTEIKDYAFLLCNSVEKIIVPSTVKVIRADAFSGAVNLKEVVLASEDTKLEEKEEQTESEEEKKQENDSSGLKEEQKKENDSGELKEEQKTESDSSELKEEQKIDSDSSRLKEEQKTENKHGYSISVDPSVDTQNDYDVPVNENTENNSNKANNNQEDREGNINKASVAVNTNNEIAGIDEGLEDEENVSLNDNTPADTENKQAELQKSAEKNVEKTTGIDNNILWIVVGAVVVILAGIGMIFWKKKRK